MQVSQGFDSGAIEVIACGDSSADLAIRHDVTAGGEPVRLSSHEYRVLSYLMHHRGRVVSQTELAEHIYTLDAERDSNTVQVFVARLRKKVGAGAIATVRGLGYRMEES